MKEDRPPQARSAEDRVRSLGFDPAYLTPRERDELIALHATDRDDRPARLVPQPMR